MLPERALQLFQTQYGLLGVHQARTSLTTSERRCVYRHPDVERLSDRVLRHRATPESLGTQLLHPVLDAMPRAVLWEHSAALWWGFGRDRTPTVHVARTGSAVRSPVGRVVRLTTLDPCDVTEHLSIPIARPERLILCLADAETRKVKPSHWRRLSDREYVEILLPAIRRMQPVIDHAWTMGLIDGEFIHEMCDRLAHQGVGGVVVLRELLRNRPPGYIPPGSGLERQFETILGPTANSFDRQVELFDDAGFIGRVDYHAKRHPLVVEVNSEIHHTSLTDRARDEARYARILATGRSLIIVWEYDVWHQVPVVRQVVRRCLAQPDEAPTLHRPTLAPWELLPGHKPGSSSRLDQ